MFRDAVFKECVAISARTFYDGFTIHYKQNLHYRLE